jgi:hypothetical protein
VFATHGAAKRWANQIESAIDRGVFVDRTECERTTVADLIDRYLSEVTPKKKSARPEKQRLNALKTRLDSSTASSNFAAFHSGAKQCPVRPATK